MTYFCTLCSGSSGNSAVYVSPERTVLIDAGKNTRFLTEQLRQLSLAPHDLTEILITHSHSDHISALPVLLKKTAARLVCSFDTYAALAAKLPAGVETLLFQPGETLTLGSLTVKTFATSHDVAGSCGYVVGQGDKAVAFCTDMGTMTGEIFETIRGCGAAVLEFNHDVEKLKRGCYPYPLKARILSDHGHLSNRFSAKVAVRLVQTGTKHLTLAHLSAENNTPELALEAAWEELRAAGLEPQLAMAPRDVLGEPVML